MKKLIIGLSIVVLVGLIGIVLLLKGVILLNYPSRQNYPVRGVDVSAYQGEINWETLAGQGIRFAFIKATEGSTFVDPKFAVNFENASRTSLRIGAYHFFSYDSSGITQAENFIATVPKIDRQLPPVVDIEFYGDKEANLPDITKTQAELKDLLFKIQNYYGVKPIIYVTDKTYDLYIKDVFQAYDIWIRSVYSNAHISDGRAWTFWQYSNRGRLKGYKGVEKFIDLNVFSGSADEFKNYGK